MMAKLIIGGAGFIGCNIANYHLKNGERIIIFDNLCRKGAAHNLKWLRSLYKKNVVFIKGDIRRDNKKLLDAINGADSVYHMAAQVAVTTSVANPRDDFENNLLGTFNVLEAVRKSKSNPPLIFASTNKVYGSLSDYKCIEKSSRYELPDFPKGIGENIQLDFHSPYGCSKGGADQYVRDYARIYNLKTVVFRQSCIYGYRQFGIEDQGWVAWFIIAALFKKPITIYGTGKQVRDILFIDDLIEAFQLALTNIKKTSGEVYNIGGGHKNTLSLLELILILEKFLGHKISYSFSDSRLGDQYVFVSDVRKATRDFGWYPETNINEGILKLFNWVKDNKRLFRNVV